MKGLCGGGDGDNDRANRAQDFLRRYEDGPPDTGFDEQEAYSHVDELIKHADADQVERATRQALQRMPESERSKFGEYFGQLQGGGGSADVDQISKMFGQRGGQAQSADDLFGGLLGGGGGGGMGGMLGGLLGGGGSSGSSGAGGMLGGLLGGGDDDNRRGDSGGGGLGGMLGGSAGKMLMGGIAAYLMKELMGGRR